MTTQPTDPAATPGPSPAPTVPSVTVPDAAVEAAQKALYSWTSVWHFDIVVYSALTAALPHLTVSAPPAPDGLEVTDAMVEAGCYAWDMTGDQHADVRDILEAAFATARPQASTAPAAPTLDSVLAEIKEMGWGWRLGMADYRRTEIWMSANWPTTTNSQQYLTTHPVDDRQRLSLTVEGPTFLDAVIALRDAIRATAQEGSDESR